MATPSPHWPPSNPRSANAAAIALSLIALLLLAPFPLGGAEASKVFALHSDNPVAVVEAVRGLYGDRATMVLAQDRLVVRADDQIIEQIGDLLTQLDPEPRRLLFTIGVGPTGGNGQVEIYSTRSTGLDRQQLHGLEGVPVVLSKVRVTERPVLGPWGWAAFEDVPVDVDSIRLVAAERDQQVTLDVRYRLKRGEEWQIFRGTVSGPLGTWLPLLTGRADAAHGRRTLSTGSGPDRPLSVKVEDARR